MLTVTQLAIGTVRIWTQAVWLSQCPCLQHHTTLTRLSPTVSRLRRLLCQLPGLSSDLLGLGFPLEAALIGQRSMTPAA